MSERLPLASMVLNNNTWEEIRAISDAGLAANYWSIGDTKTIVLNGAVGNTTLANFSVEVFIIGFDHNAEREGANRIHFQIGKIGGVPIVFADSQYDIEGTSAGYFRMNLSNTNSGGWGGSYMRKTMLGNTNTPDAPLASSLMAAIPADLRAVVKPCIKYTDNTGGGSDNPAYVTSTTDYLFLLAEFELHGTRELANNAERNFQEQYDYYAKGNSKIKYKHSDLGTTVAYWGRSPRIGSSNNIFVGGSSRLGTGSSATSAYRSYGTSPAFCV